VVGLPEIVETVPSPPAPVPVLFPVAPTSSAPPPPPAPKSPVPIPFPPSFPWLGAVDGVFPEPPLPAGLIPGRPEPPPPDPPSRPFSAALPITVPPPPPPLDVIVLNTEFDPLPPVAFTPAVAAVPPAPTVTV
jgi:hypothetical protein